MNLTDIPVILEDTATANLPPVLHEIRYALRRLERTGEPSVIDLLGMPFGPGELDRLIELLGEGEVDARIETLGTTRVYETRFRGVWLVDHGNADGSRMAYQIEITRVPDILYTQPEDLGDSMAQLEELLGVSEGGAEAQGLASIGVPVLGFAAYSGVGKTTLLKQLIPLLRDQGLRVGLVKHAHHNFDPDTRGKDSYELRKAGAGQVLVASDIRWALVNENDSPEDPDLETLLMRMDLDDLDLILVEGFKHQAFPKIELHRPALGKEPIHTHDPAIIALATDAALPHPVELPVLDLNMPAEIVEFVLRWLEPD